MCDLSDMRSHVVLKCSWDLGGPIQ